MAIEAKSDFFRKVNEASSNRDYDFFEDVLADDVVWTLDGEKLQGKEAAVNYMKMKTSELENGMNLTIDFLLIDGAEAVVKGKMTFKSPSGEEKNYLYCDIYQMDNREEKIQNLTSFFIELKE